MFLFFFSFDVCHPKSTGTCIFHGRSVELALRVRVCGALRTDLSVVGFPMHLSLYEVSCQVPCTRYSYYCRAAGQRLPCYSLDVTWYNVFNPFTTTVPFRVQTNSDSKQFVPKTGLRSKNSQTPALSPLVKFLQNYELDRMTTLTQGQLY